MSVQGWSVVIVAEMYVDRKLLKWLPFQSLPEQGTDLADVFQEDVPSMPILSEDDYALMQYRFEEAFKTGCVVRVTIFRAGRSKQYCGQILGFDPFYKTVLMTEETVLVDEIIALEII